MKKHYTLLTGMIFFLLVKIVSAQNLQVSSGNLDITGGSILEINGSFGAEASSVVKNDSSTLKLTGDFYVDPAASYTSTGIEEFFGSGIQNIYFISGTNYLGVIVKNNNGKLFLLGNVDCNRFVWTSDYLVDLTSGATLRVKNGSNTAISGYGPLRYFDVDDDMGSIQKLISVLNVNYVIPVGNSLAGYRPIVINESSFGVTGAGFINVILYNNFLFGVTRSDYFSTGFSVSYPGTCTPGLNPYLYQLNCLDRFGWRLRGPSGHVYTLKTKVPPCNSLGTGPNRLVITQEGTPDFTLNFLTSIIGSQANSLCLYSNFDGGVDTIPGGPYGFWGDVGNAGGDSAVAVLPITLLYLTATPQAQSILVQWATASELNNNYFNLQRSTDAKEFTTIGWFDGHGTTSYPNTYNYDDKGVVPGIMYYYRLESVDFDGTKHYSEIVNAIIKGRITTLLLSPNLTTGIVHASQQVEKVVMHDVSGRELQTFVGQSDFDIQNFANGMYFFTVITTDGLVYPGIKITLQK